MIALHLGKALVLTLLTACSSGTKQPGLTASTPAPAPLTDPIALHLAPAELADMVAGLGATTNHATEVLRVALTAGSTGPEMLRVRCDAVADRAGRREVAAVLYAVCAGATLDGLAMFSPELRTEVVQYALGLALADPLRGEFRRDLQTRLSRDFGLPAVPLAENLALDNVLGRLFVGSAVDRTDVKRMLEANEDERPGKLLDLVVPTLDEMVRATEDGVSGRNPAAVAAAMCRLRAVLALGDYVTSAGTATAFGLFGNIWKGVKSIGSTAISTATSLMTGGGLTSVISAARNVVGTVSSIASGVKTLIGGTGTSGGNPRFVINWNNPDTGTQRMLNSLQRLMRQTKNEILARVDVMERRLSRQLSELYARMEQGFRELTQLIGEVNRNLTERLREMSVRLDTLEDNIRRFVADNLAELAEEIEQRFSQVLFQAMNDALVQVRAKIAALRADRDPRSFERTVAEVSALIRGSAQTVLLFAYSASDTEQNLGRHTKSMLPFWHVVPLEVLASAIGVGNTILVSLGARPVLLTNPVALATPTIELAQALATSPFFPTRAERAALVGELLQAMAAARANLTEMFSTGLELTTARLDDLVAPAAREWSEVITRVPYRTKITTTDRTLLDRWVFDGTFDAAGYARYALPVGRASFVGGRGPVTYFVNNPTEPLITTGHDPIKTLVKLGLLRVDGASASALTLNWDIGSDLPSLRTYTGQFGTLQLVAAGTELEVRLTIAGASPIGALEAAQEVLAKFETDFTAIIRRRLEDSDLRSLRSLFSMQSATRMLLELARDTYVADGATRTRIVALLERPLLFAETLSTLLGVQPTASLSWSLHVKRLLSARVDQLFAREVALGYLDELVPAMQSGIADLRADAATLARAIAASDTVLDYASQALRAWVEAGGVGGASTPGAGGLRRLVR